MAVRGRPTLSARKRKLEVEPNSGPHLAGPIGACRNKEILPCGGLPRGRARTKCLEIYEFGSVAEDRGIQDIIELKHWPQLEALTDLPFAGNVQIEQKEAWTNSGISRQVTAFGTDRLERKLR